MAIAEVKYCAFVLLFLYSNIFFNVESRNVAERVVNLKSRLSKYSKLVVISFDGFRYDFIRKTDTPNFDAIKASGVYVDHMRPRFPTKTFPNHQSIATGLYPESHGVIANDRLYDDFLGKEVGPGDPQYWNFRLDVAPIWVHNEQANNGRFSASNWPGSNFPYGKNKSLPTYAMDYASPTLEQRMDKIVEWLTDTEKPANLIMMYFNEPDETAHSFGPESDQVISAIKNLDAATGYLLKKLNDTGIKDDVNLILLSDHGFQEVTLKKVIRVSSMFNQALVHRSRVSTPITFLSPKEGKLNEVYQELKSASVGKHFTVYLKDELPEGWHIKHNRRIYPIILVADLGYVFDNEITSPDYDDNKKYGVHGYDNNFATMQAFFMATGPAFKKGYVMPQVFSNVDVFPLMCKIIDLKPPPNNGTLTKIGSALI